MSLPLVLTPWRECFWVLMCVPEGPSSFARYPASNAETSWDSQPDSEPSGTSGLPGSLPHPGFFSSILRPTTDAVRVLSSLSFVIDTSDESCSDGQFMRCQPQCFLSRGLVHTAQFKQDSSRLHDRNPEFRDAFSRTHSGFSGLLGDRFVGENPNPDFSFALHHPRQGDAGGLDLALGDPPRLHRFQSKITEGNMRSPGGLACHPAPLFFSKLYPLWHQHDSNTPLSTIRPQNFAFADPDLYSDRTIDRAAGRGCIINIRTDRLQRNAARSEE